MHDIGDEDISAPLLGLAPWWSSQRKRTSFPAAAASLHDLLLACYLKDEEDLPENMGISDIPSRIK